MDESDQVLRDQRQELAQVPQTSEQRARLEQRIERLRQQRWGVIDAFPEEKRELVRLRGEIVESRETDGVCPQQETYPVRLPISRIVPS